MKWINHMKEAMKAVEAACAENTMWDRCRECPFDDYCTALMDAELFGPRDGAVFTNLSDETKTTE